MLTLLSECHFWTTNTEDVRIKTSNFGSFKYIKNKDFDSTSVSAVAKREYADKRGIQTILKNKKTCRLKDNLKKLEDLLKNHTVVHTEWKNAVVAQILFSNGVLVHTCVDIFTGDLLHMAFDKFFIGKLASDCITDAIFTRRHILLAYNTNQITVVYFQNPNTKGNRPEKISNMDPKIVHVLIPGPTSERKLERKLVVNIASDLIVVWTKFSQNEVFPWRPTVRDLDRANILLFKLKDGKMETFGYCWTENDPICVEFSKSNTDNQIITIEQKVSRKGEITAEICSYELTQNKMHRNVVYSISVGAQICCHQFSPDQEKLFIGTVDRNVYIHDLVKQKTKMCNTNIEIIPTHCVWHPDSAIVVVSSDHSQIEAFDLGLVPMGNQLISEDITPSNVLDLSQFFTSQPNLLNISFSKKPDVQTHNESYAQTDCFLMLTFETGPIACLRYFCGAGMSGDIHNSGLTADVLVNRYLLLNQFEKAVNLMMCINWESYGAMSLMSLHKIANFIFTKNDLKKPGLEMLSAALKTFTDDLSEETKDEFGDQIFDLRRRFFLFLLRHEMFIDAFQEGLRIEDYDLFMDLYNVTNEKHDISQAAYRQAAILLNEDDENPISSSSCSYSSCSNCTTPTKTAAVTSTENYVPPLPSFKVSTSKIYSTEHINIPKPEYRRPKQQTPPDQVLDQTLGIPVSLTVPRPSTSAIPPMPYYGPKYYQYPLVSGTIPPPIKSPSPEEMQLTLQKKPAASILSNNNNNGWTNNGYGGPSSSAYSQNGNGYVKKDNTTGEQKNKVKFSDTVQVAVVPEITRKDKSSLQQKRIFNNIRHPPPRNYTNPRKELADSLPLCHPHGEYLKDFDPVDPESIQVPRHPSTNNSSSNRATNELNSKSSTSSIKVVQFGVV